MNSRTRGDDPTGIDAARAQALAERCHGGQRDEHGGLLLDHIQRVVTAVSATARGTGWLHEVFRYTSISEEALLAEGLSLDELRALRLLAHGADARSNRTYLAHFDLIARAGGPGAGIAQTVKRADLADRVLHRAIRADGWSPPYELGLDLLRRHPGVHRHSVITTDRERVIPGRTEGSPRDL